MPTGSGILRLARGRSSAIDLDTEEGRAFLQERLAFYNKVCFLISGSFFVVSLALIASGLQAPEAVTREHERRAVWLHAATLVVGLSVWCVCSRGPRLGSRFLRAIDAGALLLVCAGFCLQFVSAEAPHLERMGPFPRVTLVLILTHALVARAVFAPTPGAPIGAAAVAIWTGLWVLCAVVVATLTSRLIYGLREQVREAKRLGQYTLEQKLGEGGMGVVYRASHAMLRRPTAIKLLPPKKAGSVNLDTLVREDGPQPPGRVVHVLRQVASALTEAHGIGGIPDVAKVVDFGLVRDLERAADVSRTNVVQGTPLYLSPEAITAPDQVDGRGDIYALGAVGYFLLTGQHVFSGATLVEVCSRSRSRRSCSPASRRTWRGVPRARLGSGAASARSRPRTPGPRTTRAPGGTAGASGPTAPRRRSTSSLERWRSRFWTARASAR
ncbi:MAG TPA: hypothetical protein VJ648_00445 [Vicinamibacteria bacterium]|nr:hypothetical protein [Vicinamibacteria bacterium]